MAESSLARRVEILEQKVGKLEDLPERVEALHEQILQLREETRVEFSTVRAEIRAGHEETRRFMRVLHEDVIHRISLLGEGRSGQPNE